MTRLYGSLRELWIVLRSVWVNLALFIALLLTAAGLMWTCGCYPLSSFRELVVTAFYMARLESIAECHHHPLPSILVFLMPALTILILGAGVLRVIQLYLGRREHWSEWEKLMASTMSGHTVLCGAGELGRALLHELLRREPNAEVVVVDNRSGSLEEIGVRGDNVRSILGDMTSQQTLMDANVGQADAVLIASGDDGRNLEAALKAYRLNDTARIWVRLYRSGLVELLDLDTRPNLRFFTPYRRAADAIADDLGWKAPPASHDADPA